MLTAYLTRTRQLLQNPAATVALYADADLTAYINTARSELAGETECVRDYSTLAMAAGTRSYAFSAISTSNAGVFSIRGATVSIASGQRWIAPRPFPYFQLYYLNNPVPTPGLPRQYSQFGQGTTGTLYVDPVPDQTYSLNLDCVCRPVDLATDSTPETIPYPYTDAVPYYAAYLAYLSAQRAADADRMWAEYQKFAARARQISNGPVNPAQYPQSANPVRASQLGLQPSGVQR